MSKYFPEPYRRFGGNVRVELDLFNSATKAALKGATGIDTSMLASKTDLTCLKTKLDILGIDKLKIVPADLSKLSNAVDNDVVKKTVHNQLVIKIDAIYAIIPNTNGLVSKAKYDSDKQGLGKNIAKKIHSTIGLVKKTDYNRKVTEIENKILD